MKAKMEPDHRFEYRSIEQLLPYTNNARTHSDKQINEIANSIKEFGFTNPVLIDEYNGIIAGHGRIMAAKQLEYPHPIPCFVLHGLTDTQRRAYVLVDNQLALNAGWDEKMLKIEIESLIELDFDVELIGFDDDFLKDLLIDPVVEGLTDEDDAPEPPKEPISKLGDVWQLGDHRLMCGDSTSEECIKNLCGDELVDMWLTDPPYNIDYQGKTKDALTIKNDSMDDGAFREFLASAYRAADSVMKPGAVFYIWHADSESFNFRGAARDAGWTVRQCLIWNKNTMVLGRQDYQWKHEPCLYGWKDGASHLWASDRKQYTVLNFDKPLRNGVHPTMKPVELFQYQILNNTRGKDIVLDSFSGSGTTFIACEKNGRRAFGMEFDPVYVDVIIQRWQAFTGKSAVHIASGKTYESMSIKPLKTVD